MNTGSKFGVSAVVGIVAGIATILGVGIALWVQFAKPSAELGATVSYGEYRVDPWTSGQVSELGEVLKDLNSYQIQGGKLSAPLAKFASEYFKAGIPKFSPNESYGYAKTLITDTGDLGAKNIAIRIPNAVGSLVVFDDGSTKSVGHSPNIDLGNLRPEQQVAVYSWFLVDTTFMLQSNQISLTYDNGVGTVKIIGKHGMFYSALSSPVMQTYLAVVAIWLLITLWSTAYRLGWNKAKAREATQSTDDHMSALDSSPTSGDGSSK